MKKLLIISNLAWMAIFVMAFKSQQSVKQKDCNTFCHTIPSNFNGLSLEEASTLTHLYSKNHYPAYSGVTGGGITRKKQDSKSVWFSLETLKNFIGQIEKYSCQNCSDLRKNLGVRIYFGEYPSNVNTTNALKGFQGLPPSYANLHTLMFVPTYRGRVGGRKEELNIDFDPLGSYYTHNCQPMPLSEYIKKLNDDYKNKKITTEQYNKSRSDNTAIMSADAETGSNASVQNHGRLCPTICQEEDTAFPVQ